MVKKPIVLCILDGWGDEKALQYNAPKLAHTPTFDTLVNTYPNSHLRACGEAVGLPNGQMGNSEVGHMNIGAGRVVLQTLPRINTACETLQFTSETPFKNYVATLQKNGGTAHIIGLISDGGVHAHMYHTVTFANALLHHKIPVKIHMFSDGRDTAPTSAKTYCRYIQDNTTAPIVTVTGRYWAMDRDTNWDRTQKAYQAIVLGQGQANAPDPITAIQNAYNANIGDEFIAPTTIDTYNGIQDGDAVLSMNFRADRTRQILTSILNKSFTEFSTNPTKISCALGMVQYCETLNPLMDTVFPQQNIKNTLGEVIANANLKQVRCAETEKYPHVTFFLNGGREKPFNNEIRLLTPSPKVATYDLKPEMSAPEITKNLIQTLQNTSVDLAIINYANPDMVGHTGSLKATIKACEVVDKCLKNLWDTIQALNAILVITADHGNCDIMYDTQKDEPHTAHTLNPVNFIICGDETIKNIHNGVLGDIAPTILHLMNIQKPAEMTGKCLVKNV